MDPTAHLSIAAKGLFASVNSFIINHSLWDEVGEAESPRLGGGGHNQTHFFVKRMFKTPLLDNFRILNT